VERALTRCSPRRDEEGILRVDADELLQLAPPRPAEIRAVVFLTGFDQQPRLDRITAGRDELALMQPMATTLSNAPATSRVFEMIRLLASVTCYRMTLGHPDQSVELLEEVFAR
jgi:hypothetical protein